MNKLYKDTVGNVFGYSPIQEVPEGLVELSPEESELVINPPVSEEVLAWDARSTRDKLLRKADVTLLKYFEEGKTAPDSLIEYRQALRDIPQQEGFPTDINWPEAPNDTP